jgi:hypothetical protein
MKNESLLTRAYAALDESRDLKATEEAFPDIATEVRELWGLREALSTAAAAAPDPSPTGAYGAFLRVIAAECAPKHTAVPRIRFAAACAGVFLAITVVAGGATGSINASAAYDGVVDAWVSAATNATIPRLQAARAARATERKSRRTLTSANPRTTAADSRSRPRLWSALPDSS